MLKLIAFSPIINKKKEWSASKSQNLNVIPDHSQLLNEGEAFVTGFDEVTINPYYDEILVMPEMVYFECDLLNVKLINRAEINRRLFARLNDDDENSLSDTNNVEKYSSFFNEMSSGYLVVSTKGNENLISMACTNILDKNKVWVCWEKELIKSVKKMQSKRNIREYTAKKNNHSMNTASISSINRFNDSWNFRDYTKQFLDLESMLDTCIELFGFDNDVTVSISRKLAQQVRYHNTFGMKEFVSVHLL